MQRPNLGPPTTPCVRLYRKVGTLDTTVTTRNGTLHRLHTASTLFVMYGHLQKIIIVKLNKIYRLYEAPKASARNTRLRHKNTSTLSEWTHFHGNKNLKDCLRTKEQAAAL